MIGEEDRCVLLASARELASALPDAKLLPETGHALLVEALAEVDAAIQSEQRLVH